MKVYHQDEIVVQEQADFPIIEEGDRVVVQDQYAEGQPRAVYEVTRVAFFKLGRKGKACIRLAHVRDIKE